MPSALNFRQASKLADFFFDIAKGLVLGIVGFSLSGSGVPIYLRFISVLAGVVVIYLCIKVGLELVKNG
jgi:hypothetical protein